MDYNYFLNIYGYEPSKRWDGYKKQLNEQGMSTDFHDEFGFGYKPGSATPSPTPSEHLYVDLGLPSGTLWATTNIQDANGNELYFAWGETQGYTAEQVGTDKNFSWNDYKFGTSDNISKYNASDGKTVLDAEDDAATVNWGSDWRMPTKEEFEELTANTTYKFTTVNDVQGAKFTSTVDGYEDKFLFFPAVMFAGEGAVDGVGDSGKYWSASLNDSDDSGAWQFIFDEECGVYISDRYYGYSVRPVRIVQ